MRIVTLEEHFIFPDLSAQIDTDIAIRRGWPAPESPQAASFPQAALSDIGPKRLSDMDQSGITVQVLSLAGPGADLLDPQRGVKLAKQVNDRLGEVVNQHPDRYEIGRASCREK